MSTLFLILFATTALMSSPAGVAMDENAFRATEDRIDTTYRSEKAECVSLKGNARNVCEAEAKAKRKIAKAEAEAEFKNTAKARTMAIVARAEAEYSVAKTKCDDLRGTQKVVCVTKAKAARVRVKADARRNKEVMPGRALVDPGKPDRRS